MNACFGDVATDANGAPLRSLSSSVLAVNVSERNINEERVAEFPGMKQKGKSCHSRITNSFLFVVWHSPLSDTLKWHQQKREKQFKYRCSYYFDVAHLVYTYIWQIPFYQIRFPFFEDDFRDANMKGIFSRTRFVAGTRYWVINPFYCQPSKDCNWQS